MNTNSMQPKVIFLYSLPKNKVAEMEQKRFNYSLFINKIQGIEGVEVHELCEDFFSTTHKCQILIVLGEYLGDEQALLLHDDSLFPLDELINKISISCNGVEVIDMAFCYSGEWREKLKKLTNALVNGNNEKTQVEARLQLYPLLLLRKDLGRENYKESYDIILDKLEKKQNRRNPQELANLPESTKLGTMSTSAVPKEVFRNSPFPVKVYIHADGDKVDIVAEIDGYRPHTISNLKLNNGDKISWELCFDTNPKPEYAQYLEHIKGERSYFDTWNSDEPEIRRTFDFFVEEAFPLNGFNGVLKTTIGENKLDEWPFTVNVLPYKDLLGCSTSVEVKNDENSISELNSTNIKNVEVDDKILEAFQNDSKEEGKRPVAIGVKSGFSYTPNIKEELEKKKQKEELKVLRREKILNQLLEWVDSGDWINDEVANEVKQMLLTVLGRGEIQLEDKEKDMSETLWNLLEVGRVINNEYNKNRNTEKYGCLATAWQNLVGYFDDKKLFKRKGSPALNKDFFGNTDGYTNIDKGRPSKETMSSRFHDVLVLLDTYCPSK